MFRKITSFSLATIIALVFVSSASAYSESTNTDIQPFYDPCPVFGGQHQYGPEAKMPGQVTSSAGSHQYKVPLSGGGYEWRTCYDTNYYNVYRKICVCGVYSERTAYSTTKGTYH